MPAAEAVVATAAAAAVISLEDKLAKAIAIAHDDAHELQPLLLLMLHLMIHVDGVMMVVRGAIFSSCAFVQEQICLVVLRTQV